MADPTQIDPTRVTKNWLNPTRVKNFWPGSITRPDALTHLGWLPPYSILGWPGASQTFSLPRSECRLMLFQVDPLFPSKRVLPFTVSGWPSAVQRLSSLLGECLNYTVSSSTLRVGSATSGFGKFPLTIPNFSIFLTWGKKNLIRWGQKYPGQRQVGPLFSEGQ